jgi:sensor histidine kinase YesM
VIEVFEKNQLTNNQRMKKYFFMTLFGAILGILICYFIILGESQLQVVFSTKKMMLSATCGIVTVFIVYRTTLILDKLISWQKQTEYRLLFGLVIHFFISLLVVFGLFFLYDKIFILTDNFTEKYHQVFIKTAILLFILIIIYEVVYFALYSYYSYATLQIETVKASRKQIELQLNALKSQLSPHFLFNSLNTISSLVFNDAKKAENFIRGLAKMYNYTLKSYHLKLITLEEEMAFVNSYQYLLQTRFENKFTCAINISDDLLTTKVPPLTLQMLVENAVKHNLLSEEKPLEILITSDKNEIKVENNLTGKTNRTTSFHIGLKNINSRYLLLHGEGISVTSGENFIVKIPVIR